jgi:SAM-dependent methyltransferase
MLRRRPGRGKKGGMADAPGRDFEATYRSGDAPWDIGGPQPEIVRLADEGEIVGDVIDVGCGTGENALFLASRGRSVLGVDAAPTAIERARAKAAERGLAATFVVGDALDLARVRRRFETGLDCGLFHTLADPDRRRYAHSLEEVLSPGSVLHLLCFSDEERPGPGPRHVSQYEIGDAFRSIFAITRIRAATFESRLHPWGAKAWLATLTRL